MKFDLSDLRPEENDEPTRTIRTMPTYGDHPRPSAGVELSPPGTDEDEEPRHTW
ncbi:MAG: hypothetical protein ACLSHO_07485 [Dysosmobacter sp.]